MDILKSLFLSVLGAMGVAALADWIWQRLRFAKRMRMTREEVKEEHRQAEGDPMVRAKQKQLRLEKAKRRMMANVPKATVVVVNPAHCAVALLYDTNEGAGPPVRGQGVAAWRSRSARSPRRTTCRSSRTRLGSCPCRSPSSSTAERFPRDHYEAVAKVIGFVLSASRAGGPGRTAKTGPQLGPSRNGL